MRVHRKLMDDLACYGTCVSRVIDKEDCYQVIRLDPNYIYITEQELYR